MSKSTKPVGHNLSPVLLPESERHALVDEWTDTIAANPRYEGLTIREATCRILRPGKLAKNKPKS